MKRLGLSVLLLIGGLAVFVFGSPYYTVFPTNNNQIYYIALVFFFLALALAFRRTESLTAYWPSAYALFIASAALLFLSTGILNLQRADMPPLQLIAVDKFSQFLHVVPVIIILTLLARESLGSIFIKIGDLRLGLAIGLGSFTGFAILALVIWFSFGGSSTMLLAGLPWILLFVFANATMEELWFRAIFLNKYAVLVGRLAAIIITALVFGASHINATYAFPGGGLVYGLVVLTLGLLGAFIMFKTDGLTGPVLFHAGYDLLIILPVLETV